MTAAATDLFATGRQRSSPTIVEPPDARALSAAQATARGTPSAPDRTAERWHDMCPQTPRFLGAIGLDLSLCGGVSGTAICRTPLKSTVA
jgi:hypothetical protein